jgi:hypothetical protein
MKEFDSKQKIICILIVDGTKNETRSTVSNIISRGERNFRINKVWKRSFCPIYITLSSQVLPDFRELVVMLKMELQRRCWDRKLAFNYVHRPAASRKREERKDPSQQPTDVDEIIRNHFFVLFSMLWMMLLASCWWWCREYTRRMNRRWKKLIWNNFEHNRWPTNDCWSNICSRFCILQERWRMTKKRRKKNQSPLLGTWGFLWGE